MKQRVLCIDRPVADGRYLGLGTVQCTPSARRSLRLEFFENWFTAAALLRRKMR